MEIKSMNETEVMLVLMTVVGTAFDYGALYSRKTEIEKNEAKYYFISNLPLLLVKAYGLLKGEENG